MLQYDIDYHVFVVSGGLRGRPAIVTTTVIANVVANHSIANLSVATRCRCSYVCAITTIQVRGKSPSEICTLIVVARTYVLLRLSESGANRHPRYVLSLSLLVCMCCYDYPSQGQIAIRDMYSGGLGRWPG